ncbi:MAG: hypothetical protein EPO40_02450 [Myxococcaceae bacterium]|nr:MAG: hypothetical protein EPO40_02450 [Myxococcaceae bacterium]
MDGSPGEVACGDGRDLCGGACTVLQRDPTHCGACGNICGAGMRCALGACTPEALDAGRNARSGG